MKTPSEALVQTAGSADSFARQPRGIVRGQKNDDWRDFLWPAESRAERRRRCSLISCGTADKAAIVVALGIDQPRRHGIDADVPGSELFRQRLCNGIDGALGGGVET
jgi:hypothetical protein